MRKTKWLIAAILVASLHLDAQSTKHLNQNITDNVQKLEAVQNMDASDKYDSIRSLNQQLASSIIAFAEATPDFTSRDISDTNFTVNTFYNNVADDGHFRIVYWDDAGGGSLRNYNYIVFWDHSGKLQHKTYVASVEQADNAAIFYTYIDSVVHIKQNNGNDLYFIMGGTFSRPYFYNQHIFGYAVDSKGAMISEPPLFKAGNKVLTSIGVDCPYYMNQELNGPSFYTLMHFSKDKTSLLVPIFPDVDDATEMQRQRSDTMGSRKFNYFQYNFNGEQFVFEKK